MYSWIYITQHGVPWSVTIVLDYHFLSATSLINYSTYHVSWVNPIIQCVRFATFFINLLGEKSLFLHNFSYKMSFFYNSTVLRWLTCNLEGRWTINLIFHIFCRFFSIFFFFSKIQLRSCHCLTFLRTRIVYCLLLRFKVVCF